jgi:hypothetical protein
MATTVPTAKPPRRRRGKLGLFSFLGLIVLGGLLALYVWATLHINYSDGERAGYVHKFSRKGWVCKTWEGELAMVNLPGTLPQFFNFSVRDAAVAAQINKSLGSRVRLHYDQHKGIPSDCFGESEYFVTQVEPIAGP